MKRLSAHAATRPPFSLLFRGAATTVWPQGIYRLSRTGLDTLDIFLVPVARDDSGVLYEAIFS